MLNCSIGSIIRAASLGPPATPALCNQFVRLSVSQRRGLYGFAFADLITLTTLAGKPGSKNTIIPNGDVDNKRSMPQPIPAPTTPPAINSEESWKPRAIAEALADPSPPSDPVWSVPILRLPRISDNR